MIAIIAKGIWPAKNRYCKGADLSKRTFLQTIRGLDKTDGTGEHLLNRTSRSGRAIVRAFDVARRPQTTSSDGQVHVRPAHFL